MQPPSRTSEVANLQGEHGGTAQQLQPTWFTTTSDAYAHQLYQGQARGQDVAEFLEGNNLYDMAKKRWSIPSAPSAQRDLLTSVFEVIRSVLQSFVKPTRSGLEREVVETDGTEESDDRGENVRELPALVVRAAGPSFEIPSATGSNLGFSNIATYFAVKLDAEVGDPAENLDEMATYARRIFREQPNRIHVRSLVITEKHAKLVHFDRAGSQITPPIDIHGHPETFIRILAGLASADERTLGLDDGLQWDILDGRKAQGTLTTTGAGGERKLYRILEQLPIPRDSILGRATTCWRVQDPDTLEEFVVKDSWRPADRVAEYEFLQLVKGLPGVVQMVSYEMGRGETKDFRCPSTSGQFLNRIATRIIMYSYGESIQCFRSVLQLICALRDAIAGHQRLVGDGIKILHRDISPNNILLGREGATEGNRGVIIDFDLAFKATEARPIITVDHTTGTRVFQSLSVIESSIIEINKHQHSYLDDLESFLYVLTFIFLVFRPDGSRVPSKDEGAAIIPQWNHYDPEWAASNKRGLFGFGEDWDTTIEVVAQHWGPVCFKLFEQFHAWALGMVDEKDRLLFMTNHDGCGDPLDSLHAHRDEHFAAVLQMFEDAIAAIQPKSTPGPPPISSDAAPSPVPDFVASAMHGNLPHSEQMVDSPASNMVPDEAEATSAAPIPLPPSSVLVSALEHVAAVPIFITPAPPVTILAQPRRSGRIRNLSTCNKEHHPSPPAPDFRMPARPPVSALPPSITQVRRSARLLKRRVEEVDEHPDFPKSKVRRTIKGRRVTTRSR